MNIDVLGLDGKKIKSIELPVQFSEHYEPDLVNRAVLTVFGNSRQAYGTMPYAGQTYSGKLSRRRRDYKGAYGKGISRVPRKTMWRRGAQFGWVGTIAPGTRGGRRAHPSKATKIWALKINVKERRKAIRSALSGVYTTSKLVVVDNNFEHLKSVKDLTPVLKSLGFETTSVKRVRAGRGKSRGRAVRYKKNPLVVVAQSCEVTQALSNIPGYDTIDIKSLNAHLLSLGYGVPRTCIFTEGALAILTKEKLFLKGDS